MSMYGRRQVGEPWYTALYKDPARLWWVPGLLTAVATISFGLLYRPVQRSDFGPGSVVGGLLIALAYVSYRRDNR